MCAQETDTRVGAALSDSLTDRTQHDTGHPPKHSLHLASVSLCPGNQAPASRARAGTESAVAKTAFIQVVPGLK